MECPFSFTLVPFLYLNSDFKKKRIVSIVAIGEMVQYQILFVKIQKK